jgi:hypothetical protein
VGARDLTFLLQKSHHKIELDEDGESGQDNMFKAHLDQNETTQSASFSPIREKDLFQMFKHQHSSS